MAIGRRTYGGGRSSGSTNGRGVAGATVVTHRLFVLVPFTHTKLPTR